MEDLKINIDQESLEKATQELYGFTIACQEATQAFRELHAEILSIKMRYGIMWPILLFFANLKGKK